MGLRIPTGREQTSWLFTSMVKNWTREDWEQIQLAARGETWTWSLQIANPVL